MPAHDKLVLITYAKRPLLNVHAGISSGARGLIFCLSLHLYTYFACVSCEGSDESEPSLLDDVIFWYQFQITSEWLVSHMCIISYTIHRHIHVKYTQNQKQENACISSGNWCWTSGGMAADSGSRGAQYHLQYPRQVSCMCCCMCHI